MKTLNLPPDIGTGFIARRKTIQQVKKWLDEKQDRHDIAVALLLAGFTEARIREYLILAEQNGNVR